MNERVRQALLFAISAHKDQKDYGERPYIYHPMRVALDLVDYGEDAVIAGLLHDTVEDTPATLDQIELFFGKEVRDIVDSVTRREDERYIELIRRAKQHPIGRRVKLADLEDNRKPERFKQLPPELQTRLLQRYDAAMHELE
jgi:(p)ppGpp synthase/HD superfamily hydrolase